MNIFIPHLIAQDIIIKCINSLTTTIMSSYNLYNIIATNNFILHSDYQNYQNQIKSTDLATKLLFTSSIIEDIIKKHNITIVTKTNISIENIIELYKDELKNDILTEEGFDIITLVKNNNTISNIPEPVNISLNFTLDIINKINCILNKIHDKIKNYSTSYFKYIQKLNLTDETTELINLNNIFDKRLSLLLDTLKIYSNVVK